MEELVNVHGGAGPAPGDRLGSNYVVGDRLGRGGMGVVHRAATNSGRDLAVKFLRPDLASDHKVVARFLQERHIFRQIRHPNVVEVVDLVAEGDVLGIVMELVNGGDLRQRLAAEPIDPALAVRLAEQIAAGLKAIHSASVVHRDLKPANILLTEQLIPKISDFGISRLADDQASTTSTRMGTPRYLAPEGTDDRGAGKPADVYALGVILFEILTGRPPFQASGAIAMMAAHNNEAPPRIIGVPEALADLIEWMMAKDPQVRPSIGAVQRDLRALAASVTAEMLPEVADQATSPEPETTSAPAPQPVNDLAADPAPAPTRPPAPTSPRRNAVISAAKPTATHDTAEPTATHDTAEPTATHDTAEPVGTSAGMAAGTGEVAVSAAMQAARLAESGPVTRLPGTTGNAPPPRRAPISPMVNASPAPTTDTGSLPVDGQDGHRPLPSSADDLPPTGSFDRFFENGAPGGGLPTWWRAAAVAAVFAALLGLSPLLFLGRDDGDSVVTTEQQPDSPVASVGGDDGSNSDDGATGGDEGDGVANTVELLNSTTSSSNTTSGPTAGQADTTVSSSSSTSSSTETTSSTSADDSSSTSEASSTTEEATSTSTTTSTTRLTTARPTTLITRPTTVTTRPTTVTTRSTTVTTRPTTVTTRSTTVTTRPTTVTTRSTTVTTRPTTSSTSTTTSRPTTSTTE